MSEPILDNINNGDHIQQNNIEEEIMHNEDNQIIEKPDQEMEVQKEDPDIIYMDDVFKKNINNKYLNQFKTQRIANNRRLIISKIILENFKSYHGKREIGPFHKSFTAIVGPNGSGKSNLIESLLFIFGKRAKWMRLNKLNELIHNSSKYSNFTKASVEVHFQEIIDKDDPEDYDPVPGTEFSIKRSVNISNVSKYEINDDDATQADVVNLLKSKGIDLDNNRFLILQGEVEQISLMKPKSGDASDPGLLEYLEDIIGSNKYKDQIDNLDIEFDKILDIKKEKLERVKISEAELLKLDEAKNIAVDFIKKEKQSFQLMNIQYQIERFRANKEVLKNEEEYKQLDIKLKDEKKKLKEKLKENDSFIKQFNRITDEKNLNDKAVKDNQKKFEDLNAKDTKLQNDKKHQLANEVKCKQHLEELQKQYQNIIENTNEIEKQLPEKEKQLDVLIKQKEKEDEKLNELQFNIRGQTEKLRKKREMKEKEMHPHTIRYNEVKNKIDELQNEFQLIRRRKSNVQHDVDIFKTKAQEISITIEDLEKYQTQVAEALKNIAEITENNKKKINDLKDLEEKFHHEIMEINTKVEENKHNTGELIIRDKILIELMKAQQRKELNGICGRLGSLGAIDEIYDCAVTTASPQLDNIVVNRYDDAIKCVEFLRVNKIGRATFIALDKIDWIKDQMKKPFKCPANSQRLFDLIQVKKEEYRTAFYFALRDTLVCDDIDIATKIAYGETRYRVVTLKGELIDITGTMSGGGKPKKGGMGHKIKEEIPQEILNKMQERLTELKKDIEEIRKEKNKAEKELQEVQKDEINVKKERQKTQMDLDFNNNQLKEVNRKIDEAVKQSRSKVNDEKKQFELENYISEAKDELEEINKEIAKYQTELNEIDAKIAEIGGNEYKEHMKKVQDMSVKVENLEKEVSKMQAQIQNRAKNLQKNKKEQQEAKDKYEKSLKMLEKLKEEGKELEEEALQVLGTQKALTERKAELEEKSREFEEENEKIKKILNDLKSSIEKITTEKDDKNKILKKAKDEYAKSNEILEEHRTKYQGIIATYDFLEDLPEIEKFRIGSQQQQQSQQQQADNDKENKNDEGILPIIEEESQNPEQPQQQHHHIPRNKRVKMNIDPEVVYSIDVFQDLTLIQLETMDKYYAEIRLKGTNFQEKINQMKPNVNSINEYKTKWNEHKSRLKELNDIKDQLNKVKLEIEGHKKNRFNEFMKGFNLIGSKLKETYQMLTLGGDAELELIDNLDPFSEGAIFSVRPPKKSWKQMSKLSGGEKTLSSLALVFALHYYKPTPLYFMDEIDAALDYKNVAIVGNYIKEKTKNAQFIIISLRNNMFELADRLIGVYKTFDATKTISINPGRLQKERQEKEDKGIMGN